jgi:hypothetical protein
MGRQVNFYITPRDITALEARIRKRDPITILHRRSPTEKPRVLSSLDFMEDEQRWLYYYLVRESDLSEVVTEHVPAQGYWTIDGLRSPVVQFNSCDFDGKILRRGRVYYQRGFYENGAWVEKNEDFQRWADSILRSVRKFLIKQNGEYIGPDAGFWLHSEGGKLEIF